MKKILGKIRTNFPNWKRAELFATFIYQTFFSNTTNTSNIRVWDVAGGKGMVSYFLEKLYNIKCVVIDPNAPNMKDLRSSILYEISVS